LLNPRKEINLPKKPPEETQHIIPRKQQVEVVIEQAVKKTFRKEHIKKMVPAVETAKSTHHHRK
jgi:hypothetical protein